MSFRSKPETIRLNDILTSNGPCTGVSTVPAGHASMAAVMPSRTATGRIARLSFPAASRAAPAATVTVTITTPAESGAGSMATEYRAPAPEKLATRPPATPTPPAPNPVTGSEKSKVTTRPSSDRRQAPATDGRTVSAARTYRAEAVLRLPVASRACSAGTLTATSPSKPGAGAIVTA